MWSVGLMYVHVFSFFCSMHCNQHRLPPANAIQLELMLGLSVGSI